MEFILFINITPLLIIIFLLFLLFAFGIANLICNCIIIFFCIFLLKDIIQEIYALLHIKIGKLFVPYEFKPTAMGKIVLIFENHIYYVKFNADGDIYRF